jgi:hypothetical protein
VKSVYQGNFCVAPIIEHFIILHLLFNNISTLPFL